MSRPASPAQIPLVATLRTALEADSFPFEYLSLLADVESWRKEVHRPIYHLHKWWAQRLGSVFRSVLLGAFSPPDTDVMEAFHDRVRLDGVVFDPFMGSGTTIGEALKLGQRAIGRDINPVSYLIVKSALGRHARSRVEGEFAAIAADVADKLMAFYQAHDPQGQMVDVLYYFWVKVVACPNCQADVDLFSSYIFAKNAYVKRHPLARVVCPACGSIDGLEYGLRNYTCRHCVHSFDPMMGPARGAEAECGHCGHAFSIIEAVDRVGGPPRHRMYAKLVLAPDGRKSYLRTDDEDLRLYERASAELRTRPNPFPNVRLTNGYNTRQVLNYHYNYWHEMFNDRQLLCLSVLAERISAIEDGRMRELFTVLFSGVLEFNNMFASYKGEGTGAVRHMFSHHILKPERMPLEANPWGTPKSSGSFSTLFQSRVMRALEYGANPSEVVGAASSVRKVSDISRAIGHDSAVDFQTFLGRGHELYLSCGDSSATDLADRSVDAVVTDPPFFDNVHYSELADFFYVWQRHILGASGPLQPDTTRRVEEVQSADAGTFAERLQSVFQECCRVLKDDGVLVFTYHHSRPDGWKAMLKAVVGGGFTITAVQPIKAEMSVASPKSRARTPIDLDMIVVCRKATKVGSAPHHIPDVLTSAENAAWLQVSRFAATGRRLGLGDVRVVVSAQVAKQLSSCGGGDLVADTMDTITSEVEAAAGRLFLAQDQVQSRFTSLPLFQAVEPS